MPLERDWCRCLAIGDESGGRMTARDAERFFPPTRTLPITRGLFSTPPQRRLAPLFLVPKILASVGNQEGLKESSFFTVCTLLPVPV